MSLHSSAFNGRLLVMLLLHVAITNGYVHVRNRGRETYPNNEGPSNWDRPLSPPSSFYNFQYPLAPANPIGWNPFMIPRRPPLASLEPFPYPVGGLFPQIYIPQGPYPRVPQPGATFLHSKPKVGLPVGSDIGNTKPRKDRPRNFNRTPIVSPIPGPRICVPLKDENAKGSLDVEWVDCYPAPPKEKNQIGSTGSQLVNQTLGNFNLIVWTIIVTSYFH